jgi:hypothetical protein
VPEHGYTCANATWCPMRACQWPRRAALLWLWSVVTVWCVLLLGCLPPHVATPLAFVPHLVTSELRVVASESQLVTSESRV